MQMDAIDAEDELPEIDDQLIRAGQRYEVIDGELVYVAPADEPHGELHAALGVLLAAHRESGFSVALDMLARTSRIDDIAPDASVYPTARHPVTGRRQLDELSFEIVAKESLAHVTKKAGKLAGRGVRRVFAIDLPRGRVLEWSHARGEWTALDPRSTIQDPCLAVDVPVVALLDAAVADDMAMHAMRLKRHPEFVAEHAEGRLEGRLEALSESILETLGARAITVSGEAETAIRGVRDPQRLLRMQRAAVTAATVEAVLATT